MLPRGGSCTYRRNEYLFKPTATNTHFLAICSEMKCVLVLNAVQYAAKRSAFWCKMQGEMVLNGVRFGAKRKVKCRLMLGEKHKNTLQRYK